MVMVKVKKGVATREPLPAFLYGLLPESLANLSWTDPTLGVQDSAWWPTESIEVELQANMKFGGELLTVVPERKVVQVSRSQVAMDTDEIDARAADVAAQLYARIAARRKLAEASGTTAFGMQVATDRDSQMLATGAALAATLDSKYEARWKTNTGLVSLTSEQLILVASVIRTHVQACFDREDALVKSVEDKSFEESMLEEGWPNIPKESS